MSSTVWLCQESVDKSAIPYSLLRSILDNKEIRAKILRALYEHEMQAAGDWVPTAYLRAFATYASENLFNAALNYLYDKGLIDGQETSEPVPSIVRINSTGIDVVEDETIAHEYQINFQTLQIGTNFGQVVQAGDGNTVVLAQKLTFQSLRELVSNRTDIDQQEKTKIEATLDALEKGAQEGTLSNKTVAQAMKALEKYGWLTSPLIEVLRHVFHL